MNFPNLLELSLEIVLALPNAYSNQITLVNAAMATAEICIHSTQIRTKLLQYLGVLIFQFISFT